MTKKKIRIELADIVSEIARFGISSENFSDEVNNYVDLIEDVYLRHIDEIVKMKEVSK